VGSTRIRNVRAKPKIRRARRLPPERIDGGWHVGSIRHDGIGEAEAIIEMTPEELRQWFDAEMPSTAGAWKNASDEERAAMTAAAAEGHNEPGSCPEIQLPEGG
jgi:hypothetical protein